MQYEWTNRFGVGIFFSERTIPKNNSICCVEWFSFFSSFFFLWNLVFCGCSFFDRVCVCVYEWIDINKYRLIRLAFDRKKNKNHWLAFNRNQENSFRFSKAVKCFRSFDDCSFVSISIFRSFSFWINFFFLPPLWKGRLNFFLFCLPRSCLFYTLFRFIAYSLRFLFFFFFFILLENITRTSTRFAYVKTLTITQSLPSGTITYNFFFALSLSLAFILFQYFNKFLLFHSFILSSVSLFHWLMWLIDSFFFRHQFPFTAVKYVLSINLRFKFILCWIILFYFFFHSLSFIHSFE